jgi:hypothetical protein
MMTEPGSIPSATSAAEYGQAAIADPADGIDIGSASDTAILPYHESNQRLLND